MLDFGSAQPFRIYVDFNRNGDLTDDGAGLTNKGSGIFATAVEFSMAEVLPQFSHLDFPYTIWFYTNKSLWGERRATHYARTMLTGRAEIRGTEYLAYITDTGTKRR